MSVAYPNGGKTYTYTFDTLGRPNKLTASGSPAVDWVKDVVYNAAHQITSMKYTTNATANYYTETRTFNTLASSPG